MEFCDGVVIGADSASYSVDITGKRDINLYVLAWTIVFGFFTLAGLMMFATIPDQSSQAVGILFGGLVAGFTGVVQYFFGSSKSSQDKTRLMAIGSQRSP